jgi:hypothetical protein
MFPRRTAGAGGGWDGETPRRFAPGGFVAASWGVSTAPRAPGIASLLPSSASRRPGRPSLLHVKPGSQPPLVDSMQGSLSLLRPLKYKLPVEQGEGLPRVARLQGGLRRLQDRIDLL